ncbi:MAG: HAD family hydrolase [Treponema sp.]|nr:HAD family hydrolase [Treponema sp.]
MKAIITDLDRTLLRTDKSVSEKTVSVLKKVQENGIKVMFATARPRRAITTYEELLHPDSVATLNGARTFINDSSIDYSIPHDSVRKMLSGFVQIPGCVISMETSKGIYANVDIPEWAPVVTDCFPEIPSDCGSIFKILVSNENIDLNQHINSIITDDSYFTVAVGTLFQIMSRTATKLNGVKAMLKAFNIEPEDAVYFGDDNDDIEPLKWCGTGVAVKNAIPEVSSAADAITASNDEDGVALWIEKNLSK